MIKLSTQVLLVTSLIVLYTSSMVSAEADVPDPDAPDDPDAVDPDDEVSSFNDDMGEEEIDTAVLKEWVKEAEEDNVGYIATTESEV